ncbi:MAG: TIGR00303 family protein [Sulfolobales archaeon]
MDCVPIYVIASTRTSTIPGISIAGASPELTLYTPALDVEYLVRGKPLSLDVIPVTPDGIPTPALLSRACLNLIGSKPLIVDAGSYIDPQISHVDLPSRCVGGAIDSEQALPLGTSIRLFNEGKVLGRNLGKSFKCVLIGESMPGGTTTAMSILTALGYRAMVSSASKENPLDLKRRVVGEAMKRLSNVSGVFEINDMVGDPLHISIAGIALGVLERGSKVILAGGTQMAAVIALAKKIAKDLDGVFIATTRWVIEDRTADLPGMVREIAPEVGLAYVELDFSGSMYEGLRKYEEGYVKEGVGAGGTCLLAMMRGLSVDDVISSIYREYGVVINALKAKNDW